MLHPRLWPLTEAVERPDADRRAVAAETILLGRSLGIVSRLN